MTHRPSEAIQIEGTKAMYTVYIIDFSHDPLHTLLITHNRSRITGRRGVNSVKPYVISMYLSAVGDLTQSSPHHPFESPRVERPGSMCFHQSLRAVHQSLRAGYHVDPCITAGRAPCGSTEQPGRPHVLTAFMHLLLNARSVLSDHDQSHLMSHVLLNSFALDLFSHVVPVSFVLVLLLTWPCFSSLPIYTT
jgi:hypothetical protein